MVKKVSAFKNPLYDRLKLGKVNKIVMVDAWTQTTPKSEEE